ncbi:HWE histidine kinase domain-containing protein [Limoniibacter endophyticus]|uniref:Blue-light-activated histidine kinase n=1 Tax=Limoniibacter endophyticus TaxID=1565040 RepID=A0A8J3DLA4_9HYPH|nr:HWE histidine kinase domain-containing protein [Limoniibacter endophyticus]GHC79689.1 signal transduction histidine kinase [Limoniibacter endophyticus]
MSDSQEELRIDREIHREGEPSSDPFVAAVRATRMPMLITDPNLPDNPIVFANDAFLRLTQYTRDEVMGQNCRLLQGTGTNQEDVAKVRDAIARRVSIEIELLNYRKDGTSFWNRVLISPVFQGTELTYFFASQFDVTPEREKISRLSYDHDSLEFEIERRIADLTRSEDRLRFVLEAGKLGSWTLDLSDNRFVASAICKETFGRRIGDAFNYNDMRESIWPEDRRRWRETVEDCVRNRSDLHIEHRIKTPAGEMRWIEVRGQTSYADDGTPLSVAGVLLDITARKKAEEHRTLLVRELNHRVKNTLATVQSIFSQTLRSATSLEEAQEVVFGRMQALASTHDVLTGEAWTSVNVEDVVKGALAPFRSGNGERLRFGGPTIRLAPRAATSLSLAIHELATNAVKYGALSNDKGYVVFNWDRNPLGNFWMKWEEHDGPAVEQPSSRGFGSRMIEQVLKAEFGGTSTVDYAQKGLIFRLETDADTAMAQEGA